MSNIITQIETQDTVDLHRSVHTHVGKPNTTTKNHIWRQRQQQTEAYNFGVEFGLEAHTAGEKIPTAFDGCNHLTKLRHSNKISSGMMLLQRAGIQLGLETVKKWAKARRKHEWNVTNTEKRLNKTISKWKTKKPTAKQIEALQKAFLAHSRAIDKLRRHQDKGTDRLYRRRKTLRYIDGPSLIYNGGCRLADGCLYMPGGVKIPLEGSPSCIQDINPEMANFTGAAHIVDITSLAGKITRRTEPKHRKYAVHLMCKRTVDAPEEPIMSDEMIGVDWGVAIPLQISDGVSYGVTEVEQQQIYNFERAAQVKQLQQCMSTKTVGSSRHQKHRRLKAKLQKKNQNTIINYQRHVAKDIATNHGVKRVVLEKTRASNMKASAKGTAVRPGKNVRQKTGLNRSISCVAPARQRDFIMQACANRSVGSVLVNPAGTSTTCFVCGEKGVRETQAVFFCSQCQIRSNADLIGALNTAERGEPCLFPDASTPGGRECRREMLDAAQAVMGASGTNISDVAAPAV